MHIAHEKETFLNTFAEIIFLPFLLPIWGIRAIVWVASIPLCVIARVFGLDKIMAKASGASGESIGRDIGDPR